MCSLYPLDITHWTESRAGVSPTSGRLSRLPSAHQTVLRCCLHAPRSQTAFQTMSSSTATCHNRARLGDVIFSQSGPRQGSTCADASPLYERAAPQRRINPIGSASVHGSAVMRDNIAGTNRTCGLIHGAI